MCALQQRPRSTCVCLQHTADVVLNQVRFFGCIRTCWEGRPPRRVEGILLRGRSQPFSIPGICTVLLFGCACNSVRQYCWLTSALLGRPEQVQQSVKEGDHKSKREKELERLQQVADWCNDDGCHRAKLLGFFHESKPNGTPAQTCCCNCERQYLLRQTGIGVAARSGAAAGASNCSASGSSFQSAGGGVFSFRSRGGSAGGTSIGSGTGRAFQFSRGTSMASTKFKAPRRLGDEGDDCGVDQGGSVFSSSSSFVFRGGGSFQSARWQGSHEGFEGSSGGRANSHVREAAEEPLRGQALMNAARARAEVGPSCFSATRRPTSSSGLAKKQKKLAKTVDLF